MTAGKEREGERESRTRERIFLSLVCFLSTLPAAVFASDVFFEVNFFFAHDFEDN